MQLNTKTTPMIALLLRISFVLAACTATTPDEPPLPTETVPPMETVLPTEDVQVDEATQADEEIQSVEQIQADEGVQARVSDHLEGVIFNARFLDIPTYEGSGQMVHPHVLFFEEKFMGYHYIMVMTPYPYSNQVYENPSILGSQDGITWEVPEGVINPVVGVPVDVNLGGYYSDPFLLRRGDSLELWFRHTLARYVEGRYVQDNMHNRIYRTVSHDLANWSELETVLECLEGYHPFMSVVVMHDGIRYRLWYATYGQVLYYIESMDLETWSTGTQVQFDLGGLGVWHHDIVFTGEKYEALFTSADWGNVPRFRLFYATSYDGIDFGTGREISVQRISPELEDLTVHKCTFVRQHGIYQMYIAVVSTNAEWKLFYFEIAEENLYKLFD